MRFISFARNPIRNVAHNVFDVLPDLETVDIQQGFCINDSNGNRNSLSTHLFRISVNCPPTFDMIFERTEAKLLQGVGLERKIDNQVSDRLNPLTWSLFNTNEKVAIIDERVTQLEKEWTGLGMLKELLTHEKL